ncbi:LysE family translocator [Fibrella sp. WM1]|uniref:LysE family translocator n=1 Tax=Fibrella musci TaxID=3242485 RepID=UPI003521B60E
MLLLFCLVSAISFAGSVHPGPVNLAVVQATLSQSRRAGLWLALGGSLPEIAYSALAAGGLMLLPANSPWLVWLMYLPVPVLLGAGIAAFRQRPAPVVDMASAPSVALPFWKGLVLSATNPQLLPFWSAVWLWLGQATVGSQRLLPTGQPASQWVFALSTAVGAFGLLTTYVWLADRQRHRLVTYLSGPWVGRLTGAAFIGMALWQALQLLPG